MQFPSRTDTIVAVSTAWQPSALGIVRISGPQSFEVAGRIAVTPVVWPAALPARVRVRLVLADCGQWPAEFLGFRSPRSYTGQDVVEIHTVGALPLLRSVCDRLIECGARRALAGEFTARAFLSGRMRPQQIDGVMALLRAGDDAALRLAARQARGVEAARWSRMAAEILDLLSAIEAGVDFVEEEDVQFAAPREVAARLDALIGSLGGVEGLRADTLWASRPHVALVGPPNAGKSALFNRLVGRDRAIVSPVIGTTRDVLSCECTIGSHRLVLQDCAGLGAAASELELGSRRAAERTAEVADLVLWVHPVDCAWSADERRACEAVEPGRRVLVTSKSDRAVAAPIPPPVAFERRVATSAMSGAGVEELRRLISERLDVIQGAGGAAEGDVDAPAIRAALLRARERVDATAQTIDSPELIALELREASELLRRACELPTDEAVLERIFSRFCVGK